MAYFRSFSMSGADPRNAAPSVYRGTQLMEEQAALSAVQTLLAKGGDPNQRLDNGATPLHLTCRQPRVTELLLAKGARVDEPWTTPNNTPLGTPLATCLNEIISLQTAIKNLQSYTGSTDMRSSIALTAKWRDRSVNSALLLLNSGASVNAKVVASGGATPILIRAYATGQPRIVQAMLERGADVLASQEPSGGTALHIVSENRDANAARDLLRRASIAVTQRAKSPEEAVALFVAWVNKPFDKGYTPLHMAALYGAAEVIPLLVEAGADLSLRTEEGKTAFDLAQAKHQDAAYRALVAARQVANTAPPSPQLAAQLKALETRNDMPGLKAFLNAHPEALPSIKDASLRLRLTGPAELRIVDIAQMARSRKKDALIIARINSSGGPYKKFSDAGIDELQKMSISDEVVAAMISITTQFEKEQKRVAEQKHAGEAAAQQVAQAPAQQQQQPQPAQNNTPIECVKLVAAIKACDQTGGLLAMGCKAAAKSQFDCPIPVERLMR